jgi:phosphate transport system permease protein
MSDPRAAFTGRSRRLTTKRSVKFADLMSQAVITVGGIGTIVAVGTVALFLFAVVLPLFRGATVEADPAIAITRAANAPTVAAVSTDEYLSTGWTLDADGRLEVFRGDSGTRIDERLVFADPAPTAISARPRDGLVLAGFPDGSVAVLSIRFDTAFIDNRSLPESLLSLPHGEMTLFEGTMVERTVEGQFRRQQLVVELLGEPLSLGSGRVLAVDHAGSAESLHGTAMLADPDAPGGVRLVSFSGELEEDMFSGESTLRLTGPRALDRPAIAPASEAPAFLATGADGVNRYVVWPSGVIARYARRQSEPAELVEAPGPEITAAAMLLGGRTLVTGRADGSVEGWFPARRDDAVAADGFALQRARAIAGSGSPVRSLAMASRNRMFVTGHADGGIGVYYMVGGERLAGFQLDSGESVDAVAVSPKEDAILAATASGIARLEFEPMYPEVSAATLFLPLWYEGYPESDFVWQSSAASDASEPKLSLVPLVFGTLKATFYSMIFGAPIALLAAIYTSEFLNPRIKAWVKPAIEMMASLPSVVLGFLAALVFAPVIEQIIPSVLALFMAVPFALVLGAFLWQLLPQGVSIRLAQMRIVFVAVALPLGVLLALMLGPLMERTLFAGSLRLWLNGLRNPEMTGPGAAGALGGWVVLLTPLAAIAVGWLVSRFIGPRMFPQRATTRRQAASRNLLMFATGTALTLAAAFGLGAILSMLGFDVRGEIPGLGSFADTYDQRNSLVVGFVMGFAIIPIIYTIADDALSTVPEHLRGASLGAGATPWQTAVRIVIPTAMSGLFSACMIGLGRAVGETMIVLMALGNTPVMNLNVFEGARTLSANLAVELPEAPQGGGHYRVLFLSALVLFTMTFALNTVAESIRLRFRKRAYQL